MQKTALATLLGQIGHLKTLAAALSEANDVEAQTMLDARSAIDAIACRPTVRADMIAGIQQAASRRRGARRGFILSEMDTIAIGLPALATQAQQDLRAMVDATRRDDVFTPDDRHLFERSAA